MKKTGKTQKSTRRILAFVLLVCSMVMLVGCYSPKDLAEIAQYKRQGKKNAVAYIKEKYGFKAKVEDVTVDTDTGSMPFDVSIYVDSTVVVDMEYEGKEFRVVISGASKNTDGYDNYQADEIGEDVLKMAEELLGEDKVLGAKCRYGYYGSYGNCVQAYYDGSNLQDLFDEHAARRYIMISTVAADLETITWEPVKEQFVDNAEYTFLNYRSAADYEELTEYGISLPFMGSSADILRYSMVVDDYKIIDKDGEQSDHFLLEQLGDVYFSAADATYIEVEPVEFAPEKYADKAQSAENRVLSDSFAIRTDGKYVCVAFPQSELKESEETVMSHWEYGESDSGKIRYDSQYPDKILADNYLVDVFYRQEKHGEDFKVVIYEEVNVGKE